MWTMTEKTTAVNVVEVRLRHANDGGEGSLVGYFAPSMLEQLRQTVAESGVFFADDDPGEADGASGQFVVTGGRVFYEITVGID